MLDIAFVALLVTSTPILGGYLAKVYRNEKAPGDRVFLPMEWLVYRHRSAPSSGGARGG